MNYTILVSVTLTYYTRMQNVESFLCILSMVLAENAKIVLGPVRFILVGGHSSIELDIHL